MSEKPSMSAVACGGVRRFAAARPLLSTCLYILFVSLFFAAFPGADKWASSVFYTPDARFWLSDVDAMRRLRHLGPHLVQWIAAASLGLILWKLLFPHRRALAPMRAPVFLLSTLILGPGVLVNLVLKNQWGRPRPHMIDMFGGAAEYVPVWWPSNQCDVNCSFVSGEGSASFWLVALAFVAPPAWRKAVAILALSLCFLLSTTRVAFGGHFLSDTMLAWGLTLLVILIAHRVLYVRPAAWASDQALEDKIGRFGAYLGEKLNQLRLRIQGAAGRFVRKFR